MILELEARLRDSQTPISRVLRMDSKATLADLHAVLQIAFDLDDVHLFMFEAPDGRLCGENDHDEFETGDVPILAAADCPLEELISVPGDTLAYAYDYDPSWEIDITAITIDTGTLDIPEVTEVEGLNLVDDTGGVEGYEEMLDALRDTKHPKHGQYKAWVQVPKGTTVDEALTPDIDTINAEIVSFFTDPDPEDLLSAAGLNMDDLLRELQNDPQALRRRLLNLLGEDGKTNAEVDAGLPDEQATNDEEPGPQGGGSAQKI